MVSQCLSFQEAEHILTGFYILSLLNPPRDAAAFGGPVPPAPATQRQTVSRSTHRFGLTHFLGSFSEGLVCFEKLEESVVVNKQTVVLLQLKNATGIFFRKPLPREWHPVLVS